MKYRVAVLSVVAVLFAVSSAHADDAWSHKTEFKWSKTTGIRIVEPEGFKVSIGEQKDSVPAVFKLANEDKYHVVEVTAPDGATWSKKIEVKAGKQTVLRVSYAKKAAAPKKAGKKARKYMGKVTNGNHKCAAKNRFHMKFEFLLDGEKIKDIVLKSGRFEPNFELPEGNYDIRYYKRQSKRWVSFEFGKKDINKDGFHVFYGCK